MAFPWLVPPLAKSTKEAYEMQQKGLLSLLSCFWCAVAVLLAPYWPPAPSTPPLPSCCGLLWICWFPACLSTGPALDAMTVPSFLVISMPCSDQCVSSLLIQHLDQVTSGSLYTNPSGLCTLCLQPDSDFPSPGFRPSKGPSADSSSAHTSWIAASGLAAIPAIDYCNVLGRSPVMLK